MFAFVTILILVVTGSRVSPREEELIPTVSPWPPLKGSLCLATAESPCFWGYIRTSSLARTLRQAELRKRVCTVVALFVCCGSWGLSLSRFQLKILLDWAQTHNPRTWEGKAKTPLATS